MSIPKNCLILISGHFTPNGNFIGFTVSGTRVHVPKSLIANDLIMHDSDNPLLIQPLYVIAENKMFNEYNANGKPTGNTFERLTAIIATLDLEVLVLALKLEQELKVELDKLFV